MSLINNKYILNDEIGAGSFGTIYKATNVRTNEKVAIKVEPIKNNTKLLKNESVVYQYLSSTLGVPIIKWYGKDEYNYYMVINLLGESLQNIIERKNKIPLKLTLQIGVQIIYLLRNIHEKGLVHRDIKPDNFLFGLNDKKTQIHIIDFGFCKSFIKDDKHIPFKKTNNLIGSPTYVSVNAHNFNELSRRDDLESLAYVLMYLFFGELNWQKNLENGEIMNNNIIKNMKINIINDDKIPTILTEYLKNVRSLEFEEKPNYAILADMFKREIYLL